MHIFSASAHSAQRRRPCVQCGKAPRKHGSKYCEKCLKQMHGEPRKRKH